MIYPIVYRSAMFSLILIAFHLAEEVFTGVWHGGSVAESLAASIAGNMMGMLVVSLIMFIAFMPFFALREIARDLGEDKLFEHFFVRRTSFVP